VATLRIFADESGTMPLDDDDGIFVMATVSLFGDPPIIEKHNGHLSWLIDKLAELDALPQVSTVIPVPGYGEAIRVKFSKMKTMARYRRMMIEKEHKYLDDYEGSIRNKIWSSGMNQSIALSVLDGITRNSIDSLQITMDVKTMREPDRKLFTDIVDIVPQTIKDILERVKAVNPTQADRYSSNIAFRSSDISINWMNPEDKDHVTDGLWLAHHLSKHYQKYLSRTSEPHVRAKLSEAGFNDFELDITHSLMVPINRSAIDKWKQDTGLPEPTE